MGLVWEDQGTFCGLTDSKVLDRSGLVTQAPPMGERHKARLKPWACMFSRDE